MTHQARPGPAPVVAPGRGAAGTKTRAAGHVGGSGLREIVVAQTKKATPDGRSGGGATAAPQKTALTEGAQPISAPIGATQRPPSVRKGAPCAVSTQAAASATTTPPGAFHSHSTPPAPSARASYAADPRAGRGALHKPLAPLARPGSARAGRGRDVVITPTGQDSPPAAWAATQETDGTKVREYSIEWTTCRPPAWPRRVKLWSSGRRVR